MNCRTTSTRTGRFSRWCKTGLLGGAMALAGTQAIAQNVAVSSTGGASACTPCASLAAAFAEINAGTVSGSITLTILTSYAEPAGSAVLNSSGAGAASYTDVTVRPAVPGVVVTGTTVSGRGVIELNGADNVTINGDAPGGGANDRDLTITNAAVSTTTYTSVIRVALSTLVTTGNANAVRNCIINGSATGRNISTATSTTGSENTTWGIIVGGGASTVAATTAPSALTSVSTTIGGGITATAFLAVNNQIDACARGIAVQGSATTVVPDLVVTDNVIGAAAPASATTVYSKGMTLQGFSGTTSIARNTLRNLESYLGTFVGAISLGDVSASGTAAVVERNTITNVYNQNVGTFGAYGINVNAGAGITVRNNCIRDVKNSQVTGTGAFSTTFGVFGIRIGASTGHSVLHNTVHLSGAIPGSISTDLTACIGIVGTTQTGCDVRNNILSNVLTGGNPTGFSTTHTCIYLPSGGTSAMGLTLNNNAYYVGGTAWSLLGKAGTTILTLQYTAAAFDASTTVPAANLRSYTTTLHVPATNDNLSFAATTAVPLTGACGIDVSLVAAALPLFQTGASAGVAVDIDGDPRGATPCIGADEFSLPVCAGVPATGTSSLTGGGSACEGQTKNMTNTGATTGIGISYQWQTGPSGGPYVDVSGGTGATTLSYTTATLSPGTYYYVLKVTCSSGPDEDISNELTLVVGATPTASATSNSPICAGQTLNLDGSGGIGTTYSWTGPGYGGGSNEDESIVGATPANTGTFVFTSTLGSCTSAPVNVSVVVNPNPAGATANATDLTVCDGDQVDLTSSPGSPSSTILTEDFNGGVIPATWTTVNLTTGATPAGPAWTLRPNAYQPPGWTAGTISSNDASQFIFSNSDDGGSGSITRTQLISPVMDLSNYTAASLSFWHHYDDIAGDDTARVEVSTNGGASWAIVQTYNTDQGARAAFANGVVSLNAYAGMSSVQFRFRYYATWDWGWAIDNVSVTGTPIPYSHSWTSTPAYFTSGLQNPTGVTVSPVPTTFEVTITNTATGCFSTANVTVNPDLTDTDGDAIPDCDDDCPTTPGEQGDACDDFDANTVLDVLNGSCACAGVPCTTDLNLVFTTDGVTDIGWELRQQGTNILVQSGGGVYPASPGYSVSTCLPDGDFYLVVTSDLGGIVQGGVQGGYQLLTSGGLRIIDNRNNFLSGTTSQIAGGEGFTLPVGTDKLIYASCDKLDWRNNEFIVANNNPLVDAQWGVNNANSGYEMWFYNPNGGYSFRRFHAHSVSDGFAPANASRACHIQINNWGVANHTPAGMLLNVKVRGRVNGTNQAWGRACRFMLDPVRAQCPLTKLMDYPGNQYLACGGTRPIGNGQNALVHARPVTRLNGNVVQNANKYQFRFRIPAESFSLTKTSQTGQYWVNTVGLSACKSYEVDVRASFDGGATWCTDWVMPFLTDPWGDVCILNTACAGDGGGQNMAADGIISLNLYPNPNRGDQVVLTMDRVEEGVHTVSVDFFDSFGKRVSARTIAVADGFVNSIIELNGELAAGMYLVNITAGTTVHTQRLVIQP